jgi:thiol-disulfide isomerase/thioredoxin
MNKVIVSVTALLMALSAYSQMVPMQSMRAFPVTAASTNGEADADLQAIIKIWNESTPKPRGEMTPRELFEWQDKHYQRYADAVTNFAARHPSDVRKWDGIVQMGYVRPYFIKEFKPEFDAAAKPENMVIDEAARSAFTERQMKLNSEVILSADAGARQRFGALEWMVVEAQLAAKKKSGPVDYSVTDALLDKLITQEPNQRGAGVAIVYLTLLKREAPEKAEMLEAKWDQLPVGTAMRELKEQQKVAQEKAQAELMARVEDIKDVKFTAADGREVDLSKMRGKVVLIDFWATWCMPCIKEIPNVVSTYEKYHDLGFEVVGVTLEHPGVTADDTSEVREKKITGAREKMIAFARKNNMPWPQHFDAKNERNELAVKYGINGIPAMFLLDKEGRIASTNARGEKLGELVKDLLTK